MVLSSRPIPKDDRAITGLDRGRERSGVLFNSEIFLLFVLIFMPVYFFMPSCRSQNVWCLIGSFVFYGWWDWRFLFLISTCILLTYSAVRLIKRFPGQRKSLLILGLSVNLGILGFFKYFNFFVESLNESLALLGVSAGTSTLYIILPVGISFYIFQSMSYLIDCYRGRIRRPYSLLTFSTYISLFPQLVAGPIVRAKTLLPQLVRHRRFNASRAILGCEAFLAGFAMKVVVADRAGPLVDRIFEHPEIHNGLNLLLGVVLFAFQIYADFAGYSLMAIGIALFMGLRFRKNFNRPYFAKSFSEFWRRWHISLSSWLRDYLYISLGGNRNGPAKTYRNLTLTMLLGGLWHGASWNFVLWGLLHGSYLSVARALGRDGGTRAESTGLRVLTVWYKRFFVFAFVCFAWIFFRSDTLSASLTYISLMLDTNAYDVSGLRNKVPLLIALSICFVFYAYEFLVEDCFRFRLVLRKRIVRFAKSLVVFLAIILLGNFGSNAFIYFQF